MKTIFRNFYYVLMRFRMATLLNVAGLSTAFAAFMVIIMQVDYDRSFDRVHDNADRIMRADLMFDDSRHPIHARGPLDEIIASSPRIETGALLNYFVGSIYLTVGEGEERHGFKEPFVTCYPSITDIFGFRFIEGDGKSMNDPDKIIMPESMARRMFGDQPAVGKAVVYNEYIWTKGAPGAFTVGGVYRDFPDNTQVDNAVYTAIDETMKGEWSSSNFVCYLLLKDGASAEDVEGEINGAIDFARVWNPNNSSLSISLMPFSSVHTTPDDKGLFKTESEGSIRMLLAIAFLIIFIAGINFTNFSIAMAPARIRGINVRRVMGCHAFMLRCTLVSEGVLIAIASWILGVLIVYILRSYNLLDFMEADMDPLRHLPLTLLAGGIALATGLTAGLYPSLYTTSFRPAMALKGSFALSPAGRKLRHWLTCFQFVISFALIIGASFVRLQSNYIKDYNQGFDKGKIAIVELSRDIYQASRDTYANTLREHPGIEDVAFAKQKLGSRDNYSSYELKNEDRAFYCYVLDVSQNFLRVMGIGVDKGRDFMPTDENKGGEVTYIFNKSVYDELDLRTGSPIRHGGGYKGHAAGSTVDVKFTSLRQSADKVAFAVNTDYDLPFSFIRLSGADTAGAVDHIRRTLTAIDPSYPFDIEYYDGIHDQLYKKENRLNSSVAMLSLLAILISMAGVFGLVVFESEYRRKEISIRRVLGSTTLEILLMFNRTYVYILAICFAVAAPLAWYAVRQWLESFAYRTPLHWWVFVVSFLTITTLTIATVTLQTRRTATTNPARSLQTD
jgi:putative ABC transport system permease protein